MTATTFSPLAVARELEAAGVERRQAEAHAEALRRAVTADRGEFVKKADLDVTKADLEAAIAGLEARLTNRLYAVVLAAVAANGLIAAALEPL